MNIKISAKGIRYWTPIDDVMDKIDASGIGSAVIPKREGPASQEPEPDRHAFSGQHAKLIYELVVGKKNDSPEMREMVELYGKKRMVELFHLYKDSLKEKADAE